MKARLVTLAPIFLLAGTSFADAKTDLQKKLDAYCAAVKKKDVKAVERILRDTLSPQFVYVSGAGRPFMFSDWIGLQKQQVTLMDKVTSMSIHIDSLKIVNGTAAMTTTSHFVGTIKDGPNMKPEARAFEGRSEQTLVKQRGKWLVTKMREARRGQTSSAKS